MIDPDTRLADIQAVTAGTASSRDSAMGIWLVTFADLVLLLLAFFVMLFSMSSLDKDLVKKVAAILPTRAEMPVDTQKEPAGATHNIAGFEPGRGAPAEYLAAVLRDGLDRVQALRDVTVTLHGDNVLLTPPDSLFTDQGDGEGLAALAMFMDRLDNRVLMVAQRDPSALTKGSEAWAEALAQASAAADRLRRAGFSRTMVAQVRPALKPADRGLALLVTGEATSR
jgi:chemotaxis protein MotB